VHKKSSKANDLETKRSKTEESLFFSWLYPNFHISLPFLINYTRYVSNFFVLLRWLTFVHIFFIFFWKWHMNLRLSFFFYGQKC